MGSRFDKNHWIAAWGVVTGLAGTAVGGLLVAQTETDVPWYAFAGPGAVMFVGLFFVFSALFKWWPFREPKPAAPKSLDEMTMGEVLVEAGYDPTARRQGRDPSDTSQLERMVKAVAANPEASRKRERPKSRRPTVADGSAAARLVPSPGDVLQRLLEEGVRLRQRCDGSFLARSMGVMRPSMAEVLVWERKVEDALAYSPLRLAHFRESGPTLHVGVMAKFRNQEADRLDMKLAELERIIQRG